MNITHEYFDTVDSTNNELKRRCEAGTCPEGTVISAGQQTAGRGRSGHDWASPPNVSVATSMVLHPTVEIADVPRITLVAAMAVAKAIEDTTGLTTQIKWPNDIIINGRKVCGILTEMSAANNQVRYVIVGIGVNVHNHSYNPQIADMAISLDEALEASALPKKRASRKETDYAIWEHFAEYYALYEQTGDLSGFVDDYNARLVNRGRRVRVLDPVHPYEGTALRMDVTGELLVEADGDIRRVNSGEVSVRGLYGYI